MPLKFAFSFRISQDAMTTLCFLSCCSCVTPALLPREVDTPSGSLPGPPPSLLLKGEGQEGGENIGAEPLAGTPLHDAAEGGHTATARLLLDRGAQANAKGYVCALAPRPPLLVLLPVSRRLSSGEKREQTFNVVSFGNRSMIAWSLHF